MITIIIEIGLLAILIGVWQYVKSDFNQKSERQESSEHGKIEEDTSFKICFDALNTIGCQPKKEENNDIFVSYQGENFIFDCRGAYARVWDPSWSNVKSDDKDLPAIREAINATNYNFGVKVVLSDVNDEGYISIHSIRDVMIHPSLPDSVGYIKSVLDSFFPIKDELRNNYKQILDKQKEPKLVKRRPIGFAASYQSDEEKEQDKKNDINTEG